MFSKCRAEVAFCQPAARYYFLELSGLVCVRVCFFFVAIRLSLIYLSVVHTLIFKRFCFNRN